jgi:hypothetical protein
MAQTQGFAVALKLVDLASGPLATVNKNLVAFEKGVTRLGRNTGVLQVRDALADVREEADKLGRKFAQVFPQLGGLAGIAGGVGIGGIAAGLATLTRNFASVGTELGRTSRSTGASVQELDKWRKAARLAGLDANAASNSFEGMGQVAYAASRGEQRGIEAQNAARKYGITADLHDRVAVMRQFNKAVNENPLLKNDPYRRRRLGEILGFDDQFTDLLSRSPAEVQRLLDVLNRYLLMTDDSVGKASKLTESFAHLGISAEHLGLNLGEMTGKYLGPAADGIAKIIDKLNASPVAMEVFGTASTALAGVLAGGLLLKLGRLVGLFGRLGLIGGAAGAVFGLGEWLKSLTPDIPRSEWEPGLHRDRSGEAPGFGSWWRGFGAPQPGQRIGPASQNDLNNNFGNLRSRGGWQTFGSAEEGIQAMAANLRDYQNKGFNTVRKIVTRWAPPEDHNDTEKMIADASRLMNAGENEPLNLTDAAMMRRMVEAMIRGEHGGALPRGASQGVISRALGGFGTGGGAGAVDSMLRLSGLGAASPQVKSFLKAGGAGLDPSSAAWCAAFVNSSLQQQGIAGSGSNVATSFEKWGRASSLEEMRKGDVLVEPRGHGPGEAGGHVGMATGRTRINPETGETEIEMISGNRGAGHDVGTDWVPAGQTMIRAPAVPTAASPAAGAGDTRPQTSLDSNHHFVLDIRGAPPGTRGQMASATGPATATVKTSFALEGV